VRGGLSHPTIRRHYVAGYFHGGISAQMRQSVTASGGGPAVEQPEAPIPMTLGEVVRGTPRHQEDGP